MIARAAAFRILLFLTGMAIGGVLLWLVLGSIDWQLAKQAFAATDPHWVGFGIASFAVALAMRSWRWHRLVLPLGPGAVARMQTSSPSRRKVNSLPSLSVIGSEPPQQISRKDPRWKRSRPEMVPPAKKSPARSPAPLMVMWASIWAAVQYVSANGATETTSPLSRISICRSKDQGAALVSSR